MTDHLRTAGAPIARPGILEIAPYVGGAGAVPGVANVRKLSANESPLGPSPKAQEAAARGLAELATYPDGSAAVLRHAIADRHGLEADRIVVGYGSDNLIELLLRGYCGPGDEVLHTEHAFAMYRIYAQGAGAHPVAAPETDLTADVDALLDRVTSRTKAVFLANPNNPTGTYLSRAEVERLHAGLPPHVLLVLDGAYAEYIDAPDYPNDFALVDAGAGNIVATRTFSKIHGLAALRLGYAYAPPAVADTLNRLRGPFNATTPALLAGAAAVADTAHEAAAKAHNDRERPRVTAGLERLGLTGPPSGGNFVLIHFRDADRAKAADTALRRDGLILRAMTGYGLPQCLRLTVGLAEDNDAVLATLARFLDAA